MDFMSKKIQLMTLLILLSAKNVEAKNHMLIMGGGGEGVKKDTMFDGSIESFGKIANRKGWDVTMAFNGGHEVTEQLIEKHIPKTTKKYPDFSKENFDKILSDTIAKIKNGEIKKGETLYMFMFTHGAQPTPEETSHKIALTTPQKITNYGNLEGLATVSMDKLEELMLLTKEKGILLGLTDMSCFGGNTLKLKEKLQLDNVCITSSSGENTPALAGGLAFGERFLKEAAGGGVVEDVFLRTRNDTILGDYPMISSDIGKELQDKLAGIITPYISSDMTGVMLTGVTNYTMSAAGNAELQCKREDDFKKLIKNIEDLKESVSPIRFVKQYKLKLLIDALKGYKNLQDSFVQRFENLNTEFLNETIEMKTELMNPLSGKADPIKFKRREYYDLDLDLMKKNILSKKEEERAIDDEYKLKKYDELENFRKKLIEEDPAYKKYKNARAELLKTELDQLSYAMGVTFLEKDFYNLEYRKMKKEMKKLKKLNKEDACRKIEF